MVIVLMGVTGSGKTTVGEQLAQQLGWAYYDADDFHPEANVRKMANGTPLTDEDRWPWLETLSAAIGQWVRAEQGAILGCSALKQSYRDILVRGRPGVQIVHLKGPRALIAQRLETRQHRYMPASLLDSQFATLEEPRDALSVDIGPSPAAIAATIRTVLQI
ncbi:MAG: gluconokinase [Gemmatimonadetes bacterium]|nr:gluconokinase [Gemmatimonadota bacterium]